MRISYLRKGTGEVVDLTAFVREHSFEWDDENSIDALVEAIGNARYVLLGEASHGTHEYYTWRARISRRLIEEKGFSLVAVEGDWPDCYRLNRYVKGYAGSGEQAVDVLQVFNRWPTWMWANWEIAAFAEWMKRHNKNLPLHLKAGFYGLDVYSLWESLEAIVQYLHKVDPEAEKMARDAIRCFEPFGQREGNSYARGLQQAWVPESCESEVVDLLMEIRNRMNRYNSDPEAVLNTEQNAVIAVHAENYYRSLIEGGPESWNIRDHHMVDTLNRLMDFHGPQAKAIIWEHNTHIGDARATDMRMDGMVNVGQLMYEMHGHEGVFSIGFGSYEGSVIAGRAWGDVMRRMPVPPAKAGSWEYILHQAGGTDRWMLMDSKVRNLLGEKEFGHRAIGVVYNPQREYGNYVPSIIPLRYDAFVFIDKTRALHPLHIRSDGNQMPDTYPFGM